MNCRIIPLLVICTTAACESDDQPAAPEESVDPVAATSLSATVPKVFEKSPNIWGVNAHAGFDRYNGAYGVATGWYWANRATMTVTLDVRKGIQELKTVSNFTEDSWFLPKTDQIGARVNKSVDKTCGYVADVRALGKAWHSFLLKAATFNWGTAARSDSDNARQPLCSGGCDTRLILTPEEEDACQNGGAGTGDGSDDDGGSNKDPGSDKGTDGLTCTPETVFVYDQEKLIWTGEASVCA